MLQGAVNCRSLGILHSGRPQPTVHHPPSMLRHVPVLGGIIVASVITFYALPLSLFAYHPIAMSIGIMIFSLSAVSSVRARKEAKTAEERYDCADYSYTCARNMLPLRSMFVLGKDLFSRMCCNSCSQFSVWALDSTLFLPTRLKLGR